MTIREKQTRLAELTEYIAFQEKSLEIGAEKLKELNNLYNTEYRDYKDLLVKKKRLQDEIEALMRTADLYSNF